MKFFSEIITPHRLFAPENWHSDSMTSSKQFCCSICYWEYKCSPFSALSMSATKISPFQISSAQNAFPRNIPGKTFLPNWWSLHWSLSGNRMIFNHRTERNDWALEWFSEAPFVMSSHLTGCLEHFADGNSIPQNQPTTFHQCQIATIQQTSLLLFCALLFLQYH